MTSRSQSSRSPPPPRSAPLLSQSCLSPAIFLFHDLCLVWVDGKTHLCCFCLDPFRQLLYSIPYVLSSKAMSSAKSRYVILSPSVRFKPKVFSPVALDMIQSTTIAKIKGDSTQPSLTPDTTL